MIPGVPCYFGTRLLAGKNGPCFLVAGCSTSPGPGGLVSEGKVENQHSPEHCPLGLQGVDTHRQAATGTGGTCRLSGETGKRSAMAGARNLWRPFYLSAEARPAGAKVVGQGFIDKVSFSRHLRRMCRVLSTFRDIGCKFLILSLQQLVSEV